MLFWGLWDHDRWLGNEVSHDSVTCNKTIFNLMDFGKYHKINIRVGPSTEFTLVISWQYNVLLCEIEELWVVKPLCAKIGRINNSSRYSSGLEKLSGNYVMITLHFIHGLEIKSNLINFAYTCLWSVLFSGQQRFFFENFLVFSGIPEVRAA